MAPPTMRLAQDPDADALLARDPLALLMGMLLDQQFPLEWAFRAPWRLAQRMERTSLDAAEIAGYDPEAFVKLMAGPPALHRYPAAMAERVQALCRLVVEQYGGDAAALWRTAATGKELLARLRALPGFGEQKARIFVALLGKQLGVRPEGWREVAGPYGEDGSRRSAADVTDAKVLAVIRRIPPGRVLTYGDVAALAETDATARDVGQVLVRHGEGEGVPWWRVLRADGTPPPHLLDRQLALLRDEGTPIAPSGLAVDLHAARWAASGRGQDAQPSLFD